MSRNPAKVIVTKLSAAQRQLDAAIRMFLATEDPLAVHTVASAAYNVLADLKLQRGRDESVDWLMRGIYFACKNHIEGKVTERELGDQQVWDLIQPYLEIIKAEPKLGWTAFTFQNTNEGKRSVWRKRKKLANFLKHADFDHRQGIDEEEVDSANEQVLMLGMLAFHDLARSVTDAMKAYHVYWESKYLDDPSVDDDVFRTIVASMRRLPDAERKALALSIAQEGWPSTRFADE
jgi:hypothetical protein